MATTMKLLLFVLLYVILCSGKANGLQTKVKPPTINIEMKQDESQDYITAGSNTKITCKGSTKNQKVDWYKPSGHVVSRQPINRIRAEDNLVMSYKSSVRALVLSIKKAAVGDSGVYECRSGDLRKNVSVCVIDPIDFLESKTEVDILKGRSITLSCQVKGDPEPTVAWLRNGEVIADDDKLSKYKIMTVYKSQSIEGLLTVTSVGPDDSGVYSCQAYQENVLADDCSLTETLNVTLNVYYAPTFDDNNPKVIPHYGLIDESAELTCVAMGYPPPTFKWYHERGEVLTEFPESYLKVQEDNSTVLSLNVTKDTIGERYKCKASNDLGEVEQDFMILELESPAKPVIDAVNSSDSKIVVVWEDDSYIPIDRIEVEYLKKSSKGVPNQSHWFKAKKIVSYNNDGEHAFTLTSLKEDTEYWIRLQLVNGAGKSGWSVPLLASTTPKSAETEELEESAIDEESMPPPTTDGMIVGLLVLAGLVILISSCILFIKHCLN